jgi:hypothetical protein
MLAFPLALPMALLPSRLQGLTFCLPLPIPLRATQVSLGLLRTPPILLLPMLKQHLPMILTPR